MNNNNNNNNNKEKLKMINALNDLKSAWYNCTEIFNNTKIEANDYIVDKYPFNESFDNIEVYEWIIASINNLKNDL